MTTGGKSGSEAIDAARRRARASGRRRSTESAEWPEFAPPVALAAGPLGVVQAGDRADARRIAVEARALAEFAASRPASVDRAQGEPGAMSAERWAARPAVLRPVSEWAVAELAVALSISEASAQARLERALTLVQRLPGTLAALDAGALHAGHVALMIDLVAPIENADVRAEVEAGLLRWAAGRVTTPAQLRDKARREVARRDARAAARRLEKALRRRGVRLGSESTDGLAAVTVLLTEPEAQVFYRALGAYADQIPDDPANPRTREQKMADCLMDLVLRPDGVDLSQVRILLTVVASIGTLAGGDEVGELNGRVIPPEMVRELVRLFGPQVTEPEPESEPAPALRVEDPPAEEELGEWWARMEERLLAELVDPDPEPVPDDELARWAGSCDGIAWLADLAENDCGSAEWDRLAYSGELAVLDPERRSDPPPQPAAPDQRWWAEADRAVDEASLAVRRADEALGHARRLVRAATKADDADEAAFQASAGRFTHADDALAVLRACTEAQRQQLAGLLTATGGGGLVERPRIALTDAVSRALVALTDLPELRRAERHERGLGPPGPTDGYRPGARLDRYMRARDRRCRQPGCRRPVPRSGELDHNVPHPLGPTSAGNLTGFCTGHHRGKHQAPGWDYELADDGTLTVTTPTGLVAVTEPPPY